ncbi:alpha/beta hydrolase [Actinokineospora pegani]|uniref:alpha/beta hydrolase n=1 Tax=Actinokineospora pegani TaxID=2654637 RepID=UPI0012E9A00B|nr:alpha/beta hydrolase-fold protein [Actinokineospora pegani]
MRRTASLVATAVVVLAGVSAPAAQAETTLPTLTSGQGLTVIDGPTWVQGSERSFTFTVTTPEVPTYQVLPGQVSGEHVVLVTLPVDYDPAVNYPVHYTLHGGGDQPQASRNWTLAENSTEDIPVITVTPNGGGRSWYTNWKFPGSLAPQNWQNFHLDQMIPFIDANLSTVATRQGRVISGHSMGGFGAFHYAEQRPELFSYVGSFSGGLDLLNQEMRAAVVSTTQLAAYGTPTVAPDAIFGAPVWPLDVTWNAKSPAQNVEPLRGMGVAMYSGDGADLTVNPVQAVIENRALATAAVTSSFLTNAGIPHTFVNYGDGSAWAPGCTGKHSSTPCLQADMDHFMALVAPGLATS